tara:strand:+ start:697 stop:831 length:135 start_codon:yes stop_codon:yes gene_type:complete
VIDFDAVVMNLSDVIVVQIVISTGRKFEKLDVFYAGGSFLEILT